MEQMPLPEPKKLEERKLEHLDYVTSTEEQFAGVHSIVSNYSDLKHLIDLEIDVTKSQLFQYIFRELDKYYRVKKLCESLEIDFPSARLRNGKVIPINFIDSDLQQMIDLGHVSDEASQQILGHAITITVDSGLQPTVMKVDDADLVFSKGMADSIANIFHLFERKRGESINSPLGKSEGGGQLSNYLDGSNPGLAVKVKTKKSGLEILYTSAAFITLNQRFGGTLSTPVESFLPPGGWYFGALENGSANIVEIEQHIPPNYEIDMKKHF
ncbi:MAG: hypothetical protein RIC29_02765 [Rhodospirillaceae bacterium]